MTLGVEAACGCQQAEALRLLHGAAALAWPAPAGRPAPASAPPCRRQDEARIKDLSLRIEKVTRQVAQRKEELEREITDTQVGCWGAARGPGVR